MGFPIEIIAGYEEARLIYLGVAHCLPASSNARLVVDIGGGSTELIIGNRLKPVKLESLYMGCVSYSLRFFPDGKITKSAMRRAELSARSEVQAIAAEFSSIHWQDAFGSSGTARALGDIIKLNNLAKEGDDGDLTLEGLENFRECLLKVGDIESWNLRDSALTARPLLLAASPSCRQYFPSWEYAECFRPWEHCGRAYSTICSGASIIAICAKLR